MRIALAAVLLLVFGGTALADCNRPTPISVTPTASESTVETDTPTTTLDCYQVAGQAGQHLSITISGDKSDATLAFYAPGWKASCNAAEDCDIDGDELTADEARSWSDVLPVTGAYLIVIDNSRSDSDYRLNVVLQENRGPPR
jgi:hypothetical protein